MICGGKQIMVPSDSNVTHSLAVQHNMLLLVLMKALLGSKP